MDSEAVVTGGTATAGAASLNPLRMRTGIRVLWIGLIVLVVASFATLLYLNQSQGGMRICRVW